MCCALVETDICWHDRQKNFDRVRALLSPVNVAAGDLILLPEMFDKGFSMDTQETADKDGETLSFLTSLAKDFRSYSSWAAGSFGRAIPRRHRTRSRSFRPRAC